ncbi:hypothetical protein PROFUN_12593 [Planoprotostelium fungivorum]|uniref:Uncharacterized protein n=1 Tax=Planoprotostelium fungivorum TaxID=1890364 RepID=A0A2P6N6A6_9EUKA|nr:hypothetical protein PROFUN_12593 [Planoprotostelium fungivorum]
MQLRTVEKEHISNQPMLLLNCRSNRKKRHLPSDAAFVRVLEPRMQHQLSLLSRIEHSRLITRPECIDR